MNPEPATRSRATVQTLVSLTALLALSVGGLVLIGWARDIAALKSVLPGWVSMKPNTAVAFILTGIALLARRERPEGGGQGGAVIVSRFCGLLAGLIGLLSLSEYVCGWNLGFDQWLFPEPAGAVGTSHPGRMARCTALCFVLFAVGWEFARRPRQTTGTALASLLSGAAMTTVALVEILSYFTPALRTYGWGGLTMMALPTATVLVALGAALLLTAWPKNRPGSAAPVTALAARGALDPILVHAQCPGAAPVAPRPVPPSGRTSLGGRDGSGRTNSRKDNRPARVSKFLAMKPGAAAVLAGVLLGWVAAGEAAAPAAPALAPVRSGCELDYPPYCIVNPDGQADGFSVELFRAALRAVGREVSFKTGPWPDIKQELIDGRLEALPLVARTPGREGIFDFTFPYLTMHGTIVVRAGNADIVTLADLRGRQVAELKGDYALEYLEGASVGAVIVPVLSYETALRELSAGGKYDAVVIQKLLALQLMRKTGLTNLMTVGPPLKGFAQSFCFAVHRGDTELLAALNEGLAIVMADGTFRALHAKWFSSLEATGRTRSRIIVGGKNDYPPYEFLDANGQPAGYNVDLTRAIAHQIGLTVEIRLDSWDRILHGLASGDIDLVEGMFYSATRDRAFAFSAPHNRVQHVIVAREGLPVSAGLKDLAGKAVLVMAGGIMEELAKEQGYGKQLVAVPSEQEALRRLAAGEADCSLVAKVPALYWIARNGWRNLRVSDEPVLFAESCFAASRGREELLSGFSEGIATLKTTGEYRRIEATWLSPYDASETSLRKLLHYVLAGCLALFALLVGSFLWSRSLRRQVASRTEVLAQEIAERTQAEAALRESEERFRLAAETANDVVYDWDLKQSVQWFGKIDELLGYARGEFPRTLDAWAAAVHPEDLERTMAAVQAHLEGRSPYSAEYRVRRKDGLYRWWVARGAVARTPEGKPVRMIGSITDFTERKQVEVELDRMRNLLEEGQRIAHLGSWEYIAETQETLWSEEQLRIYGLNPAGPSPDYQVLLRHHIHPDDAARLDETFRQCLQDRAVFELEHRLVRPDGSVRVVQELARPYFDDHGKLVKYVGATLDITERKETEAMLQLSEARYRFALEVTSQIGWSTPPDGLVEDMPMWRQYTGQSLEEVVGWKWLDAVHPDDRACAYNAWSNAAAQKISYLTEYRIRRADGVYRNFMVRGIPLLNADGSCKEWVGTCIDITERKAVEEKIRSTLADLERSNQELEQFAYIASHDLQEPLRMVASYTQLLAQRFEGQLDDKGKKYIRYVVDGAFRMQALINDLLAFSRVGTRGGPLEITSALAALEVAQSNLTVAMKEKQARLSHDELPMVVADPSQLGLLFQNLIGNAIKFHREAPPQVHVTARDQGCEWVFAVKDNGIGIEPQHAERVFVIFQRLHTHEEYPGTGIGLAVCKQIVARHGGRIWFESEPGQGTTFFFTIPKQATTAGNKPALPSPQL